MSGPSLRFPPSYVLIVAYHAGYKYFDVFHVHPEGLLQRAQGDFSYWGIHLIYMEVLRGYRRAMREVIDRVGLKWMRGMVVKYGDAWFDRYYDKNLTKLYFSPVEIRLIKHYALHGTLLL